MDVIQKKITVTIFTVLYFSIVAFGQSRKPNILFIMTDQQRADMMSCAGNTWLKTPNLDRLAPEKHAFHKSVRNEPRLFPLEIQPAYRFVSVCY